MSKYSVVRGGTPYTGPIVVTKVDDSRLAAGGGGTGLTVMVVGESTGGFPAGYTLPNGTVVPPMIFGSSGEATSKLRSGELLWMVQRAFAGGAPKVAAVRVN